MARRLILVILLAVLAGPPGAGKPATHKQCLAPVEIATGFRTDFCRHLVPLSEFRGGGPGKDGIRALDHPRFAAASKSTWLGSREPVIELAVGGDVRAYRCRS